MEKQTWIHVGFPKCASTSLQRDFFAKSEKICFIGRSDDWHGLRKSCHNSLMALATLDEAQYKSRKKTLEQQIKTSLAEQDGVVNIVSDELLVSFYRPYLRGIPVADVYLVAKRLKSIFPDAKILMVIRNQIQFLSSMLGQLMRNNRVVFDMDDFFAQHKSFVEQGVGSFLHLADYNRTYGVYSELFGAENIEIVLLENLGKSPRKVIGSLLERMGVNEEIDIEEVLPGKQNSRTTADELVRYRYRGFRNVTRFVPSDLRKIAIGILSKLGASSEIKKEFSKEDLDFLDHFYGFGNRALQEATGLDLDGFGYPMGRR